MTVTAARDLTSRQMEFFRRFLRDNPKAMEEWTYEGYVSLNGTYGLYDIINPSHPFQG